MRRGRGVGQVAQRLIFKLARGHERKRRNHVVAGLGLHFGKVDSAHVHARGRAGLEPPQTKPQLGQRARQRPGGEKSLRPGLPRRVADDYAAFEVYARAQHRGAAVVARAGHGDYRAHSPALSVNAGAFALTHGEMRLSLKSVTHTRLIRALVGLRAQREYRRAF